MIARAGFTSVWLPPPSDSVSPQGYLPRDIYNLNSAYGSEGELRELLYELRDHELKAIADIVINHRCAHFQVLTPWREMHIKLGCSNLMAPGSMAMWHAALLGFQRLSCGAVLANETRKHSIAALADSGPVMLVMVKHLWRTLLTGAGSSCQVQSVSLL